MTTAPAPWVDLLQHAPRSERRRVLTQQVTQTFKRWLHMSEAEPLALDESYFAQGLTSLGAVEVQQQLEAQLGCRIDSANLYNHPSIAHLIEHVCQDLLPALFADAAPALPSADTPDPHDGTPSRQQLDALLNDLYEA